MTTSTPNLTAVSTEPGLESAWWALRLGIGLTAFAAGLDKFFNLLTDWSMYVAPWVERLSPIPATTMLRVFGVVEMAAAVLVLSRLTRWGAYVVAAWLSLVAVQLLTTGTFFDLAARDVVMAIAAFALAKLTEWRQPATRKEIR
jgi:uncharacterized membrane protein YphA (DoxX/SURF4 family)